MCSQGIKDGGTWIFPSLPLLSLSCCLSLAVSLCFFTNHLTLIYIILLFILQLSWAIHLHVYFFPFSGLFSLCDLSTSVFTFLRLLFSLFTPVWKQSRLSETSENTESLLSVYSFPLSHLAFLSSPSSIHTYIHKHTHTNIHHVKFKTCSWQG